MPYEKLQREAAQHGVYTYEKPMLPSTKGLYSNDVICINRLIPTVVEKACILAEELGHFHTTVGNIIDQKILTNRKHEKRARSWAFEKLVPLTSIAEAHKSGIRNRNELAERLGVTEEFLASAFARYQEKYGLWVTVGKYTVCFDPLGVLEMFE